MTDMHRRDFFKALAASAFAAGVAMPIGFPREDPAKWVEISGIEYLEKARWASKAQDAFLTNMERYDTDAYFGAPPYDADRDVYRLPVKRVGKSMDDVHRRDVRDDVIRAMKKHGLA